MAADVVVLDPPRTGAGRGVCAEVAALRPRVVAYVACDPAALARDTAYLADAGYRLDTLRAFDAFPMTHHVECVAGSSRSVGIRRGRAGLRRVTVWGALDAFTQSVHGARVPRASRVSPPRHRLDATDPVWLDILTSR